MPQILHFRFYFLKVNLFIEYLYVMAQKTYINIQFPFQNDSENKFLELTRDAKRAIKSDLIHLLLTRKGSRYFLPDFGTRLYEFIFEPFDGLTFDAIQSDIRDAVAQYMPNLLLNNITITPLDPQEEYDLDTGQAVVGTSSSPIYRFPGKGTAEYTAKIKIDYSNNKNTFAQSDFVIINI